MKRGADERTEEVLRFVVLREGGNVVEESLPVFLAPGIVSLEKRHEELVPGVQDFADGFYMGIH